MTAQYLKRSAPFSFPVLVAPRAARQIVNARAAFASFPGEWLLLAGAFEGLARFLLYIEGLMQRSWFGS